MYGIVLLQPSRDVGEGLPIHFQRRIEVAVKVDAEECVGCENCVPVCPTEAITMVEGKAVIDQEKCTECGTCIDECPVDAISEE